MLYHPSIYPQNFAFCAKPRIRLIASFLLNRVEIFLSGRKIGI
jgi:hypothetical protein